MQTVQLSQIVKQVKIILNENIEMEQIFALDPDQLQLEELIGERIIDAVRFIHENGRREFISDGIELTGTPSTNQDGTGYIGLPENFLRLIVFQLTAWNMPVIEPISDADPKYLMQKSKFTGVRGGPSKPVCAITNGIGGKVLEFYSVPPGTTAIVKIARYLPIPEKEGATIKICPKLKTAIYYHCAGLVALTFKDQVASSLFDIAKSYL